MNKTLRQTRTSVYILVTLSIVESDRLEYGKTLEEL
jgi:hypothetical protein